jgi:hypothetical protein
MRRKATTSAGASCGRRNILLLLAGGWLLAASLAAGAESPRRVEPYALIAGTVFRDSGFTLAGAEVTVTAEPGRGEARAVKFRKTKAVTDGRGEFAIRVPVTPMRYRVVVRARGFQPQQKTVQIEGDQRVDVFFQLEPVPR